VKGIEEESRGQKVDRFQRFICVRENLVFDSLNWQWGSDRGLCIVFGHKLVYCRAMLSLLIFAHFLHIHSSSADFKFQSFSILFKEDPAWSYPICWSKTYQPHFFKQGKFISYFSAMLKMGLTIAKITH